MSATSQLEPGRGTCLICDTQQTLMPGGAITNHPDPQDTSTTDPNHQPRPCAGSGLTPAASDGKDPVRRLAIRQLAATTGNIATKRAELAADLERGWKIGDLIAYHAETIIRMETMALRWLELSYSGDWWAVFHVAQRGTSPGHQTTNPIDWAIQVFAASGNRAWIAAVRTELLREATKLGDAQPIIDNLLLGF